MTERQLQFRVGLLTVAASAIAVYLTFQFGEIGDLWRPTYPVNVLFERAPGVYVGTPVKINGVKIGKVNEVRLNRSGVVLALEIERKYFVARDAEISLSRGLLGDTSLNVHRGESTEPASPEVLLAGRPYIDPMEAVQRMEGSVASALATIESTSEEWREVGQNVNSLLGSRQGELEKIVAESAESLRAFSVAMRTFSESARQANEILGDPQNQENLRRTLAAVPMMIEETRATIAAVRGAVEKADENLANLAATTEPLAKRSQSMAIRLEATLAHVETLAQELSELAQLANNKNGTIRSLAEDDSLYRNLNSSAESLTILMTNLEPILRDLRVFSDKIARHPELLGVGGVVSGSDGTKPITPVGFSQPEKTGSVRLP